MYYTRRVLLLSLLFIAFTGYSQVEKSDAPNSFPRSTGYNFGCFDPYDVDLDVDTNRDGNIINDDESELDDRGLIVEANITVSNGGLSFNQLNNMIETPPGLLALNKLIIRKINWIDPTLFNVQISVSDNSKIRIFNEEQVGIIGPEFIPWGGPNQSSHTLSSSQINNLASRDLEFLLEGVDHANSVIITLKVFNIATTQLIGTDEVNVVVGIPFANSPTDARNYINAKTSVPFNSKGAEATINTSEPVVWWTDSQPTLGKTASACWVGLDDSQGLAWFQTGNARERVLSTTRSFVYFEIKEPGMFFPWRHEDINNWEWGNGTYRVEIDEDKVVHAYFNNEEWMTQPTNLSQPFPAMVIYQSSTETHQSVARSADGTIVGMKYKDSSSSWNNILNFDLNLFWYKGNDLSNPIVTPIDFSGATYEDFSAKKIIDGMEFSDLREF